MKFVKLLLATTAFFATAQGVQAEPITAAIFGAAFAATIPGQLISLVIVGAINYGVSLVTKALTKTDDTAQDPGTSLSITMGDTVPISFIAGRCATAGKRKYIGTYGSDGKTPNAYLVDVIEIQNLPGTGLPTVWVNDDKVTVLWGQANEKGAPVQEYRRDGKDYLWIKYYDGTQTAADPYLRAQFGNDPDRPYTTQMIGKGCAYVIATSRYNRDIFVNGAPSFLFEVDSVKFYDIRKDSTNGGSGAHRWNLPATWEPSNNNAVIIYNIIRGVYYGDQWVYGGQNLSAFRLPSSNWIAAANECDAQIELIGGGTEPAFRAGYEIKCDERPIEAIDKLRKACNGRLAEVGGIFKLLVGSPGAAVYSFTDDDVLVTEGQTLNPFPTLSETVNAVEATYPEPAEKWASKDAPARYDEDLEVEDGNRRLPVALTYEAAPYANQVQRLMLASLQDARRFAQQQFHLPPDAYALEPNDVVSWSSEKNGYINKKFLVTSIVGARTFNQMVVLKEIDPSDYDWNSDYELPTEIGWVGTITPPAQPMYGWIVEPATLFDADGDPWRPSIRVSTDPDQDDVANVWIQVRLDGTDEIVFDSTATPYASPFSWILQGQFKENTDYEVRGKFIPYSNRETLWSEWFPVKTPNVPSSEIDYGQIRDYISDSTKFIRENTRQLILEQQRLARLTNDQDFGNFVARQTMRRELSATVVGVTASYTEAIVVAVGPNSAIALRIEELEVYVNDTVATAIDSLQTEITEQGDALANAITSLSAGSIAGDTATANFRMSASAGPSGYASRIAAEVRVGGTGGYRSAGWYMDVPASIGDPTRFLVLADQFVVSDGDVATFPLVFQDGELTLNVANIGTVNAGIITSPNGKMVINIDAGTLEIYS